MNVLIGWLSSDTRNSNQIKDIKAGIISFLYGKRNSYLMFKVSNVCVEIAWKKNHKILGVSDVCVCVCAT